MKGQCKDQVLLNQPHEGRLLRELEKNAAGDERSSILRATRAILAYCRATVSVLLYMFDKMEELRI